MRSGTAGHRFSWWRGVRGCVETNNPQTIWYPALKQRYIRSLPARAMETRWLRGTNRVPGPVSSRASCRPAVCRHRVESSHSIGKPSVLLANSYSVRGSGAWLSLGGEWSVPSQSTSWPATRMVFQSSATIRPGDGIRRGGRRHGRRRGLDTVRPAQPPRLHCPRRQGNECIAA